MITTTVEKRRTERATRKRAELVDGVKSLRDAWEFYFSEYGLLDVQVTVEPDVGDSAIEGADDHVLLEVVRAAEYARRAILIYELALDRLVNPEPEETEVGDDVVIE